MCSGREFQVDGADADKAREENLLLMPYCQTVTDKRQHALSRNGQSLFR